MLRAYEELLAYLYTSGTRFGASDLADYLSRFRDPTSGELPQQHQYQTIYKASEPGAASGVGVAIATRRSATVLRWRHALCNGRDVTALLRRLTA
ncbi:MAG: hypothetical protein U0165_08875 [Polyangiaceae bacterium]